MKKNFVLFFAFFFYVTSTVFAFPVTAEEKTPVDVVLMKEYVANDSLMQVYVTEDKEKIYNAISLPYETRSAVENAQNERLEAKKQLYAVALQFDLELKEKELKHEFIPNMTYGEIVIHEDIEKEIREEQYLAHRFAERKLEQWKALSDEEKESQYDTNYGHFSDHKTVEEIKEIQEKKEDETTIIEKSGEKDFDQKEDGKNNTIPPWQIVIGGFVLLLIIGSTIYVLKRR